LQDEIRAIRSEGSYYFGECSKVENELKKAQANYAAAQSKLNILSRQYQDTNFQCEEAKRNEAQATRAEQFGVEAMPGQPKRSLSEARRNRQATCSLLSQIERDYKTAENQLKSADQKYRDTLGTGGQAALDICKEFERKIQEKEAALSRMQ
jgi:chromosome segregation ATPase